MQESHPKHFFRKEYRNRNKNIFLDTFKSCLVKNEKKEMNFLEYIYYYFGNIWKNSNCKILLLFLEYIIFFYFFGIYYLT